MRFKVDDKVVTEEGKEGIIFTCFGDSYGVRVKNKFERWDGEGLRPVEENTGQEELLLCKKCGNLPQLKNIPAFHYSCECLGLIVYAYKKSLISLNDAKKIWNEFHGQKPKFKKGDVVYVKAIVCDPVPDAEGDISVAVAYYTTTAEQNLYNDNTDYVHKDSVFTLEQLQGMNHDPK